MDELLQHLREREVALHQPGVRADVNRLEELLHESFAEIGRSGRSYSRADILGELPLENTSSSVLSQDFCVAVVTNGVALLTYKSAHVDSDGTISCHALRSSLWLHTAQGWQVRFHQGTPTDAFK